MSGRVWVWGIPMSPVTRAEAAEEVVRLIERGRPSYLISANTNYAMLAARHPELREINERAALVLVDGTPMVWASRLGPSPLPERVAGSDFIDDLCAAAARSGKSLYLLGGRPGVAEVASRNLEAKYPGLRVVGTACPTREDLEGPECESVVARVREARPDVLLLALSQPSGEIWMSEHYEELGVPVCIQFGAALDFVAGTARRAPAVLRKFGMEWAFRTWLEPRRMLPRYARNARFLAGQVVRDVIGRAGRRPSGRASADGVGPPLSRRVGEE